MASTKRDFYEVLEVSKDADDDTIKAVQRPTEPGTRRERGLHLDGSTRTGVGATRPPRSRPERQDLLGRGARQLGLGSQHHAVAQRRDGEGLYVVGHDVLPAQ